MRILYAGESEVGGPANYLLGILRFLKADFLHVPPTRKLSLAMFHRRFDAILLSDFPRKQIPPSVEEKIVAAVGGGSGLLMGGGWSSFGMGGYRGSRIEEILPVTCTPGDDRLNLPSGAWLFEKRKHPIVRSLSFSDPPVICGLNQIRPTGRGLVVLAARRISKPKEFPLLVIDRDPRKRIAALATDLAPHWAGGLVDWGLRRLRLPVKGRIQIEVGERYVRFVTRLLSWLARS